MSGRLRYRADESHLQHCARIGVRPARDLRPFLARAHDCRFLGAFHVEHLDLFMSGRWQVTLGVELEARSDTIDFALDVP